jgi:hypothetical protein
MLMERQLVKRENLLPVAWDFGCAGQSDSCHITGF